MIQIFHLFIQLCFRNSIPTLDHVNKRYFYAEVEKVIELANLVHMKYFVSQKIFGDVTYNSTDFLHSLPILMCFHKGTPICLMLLSQLGSCDAEFAWNHNHWYNFTRQICSKITQYGRKIWKPKYLFAERKIFFPPLTILSICLSILPF